MTSAFLIRPRNNKAAIIPKKQQKGNKSSFSFTQTTRQIDDQRLFR
jgi:hypothetical protein